VLLRGGRIIDPASQRDEVGDVLIEDDLIVAVAPHIHAPPGAQVIDVQRLVVTPGLIDLHVHV
jgi:dihydroorotase